jgi:hypothetical protein
MSLLFIPQMIGIEIVALLDSILIGMVIIILRHVKGQVSSRYLL